ncbi:hypothetical protein FGO68_gene15474 [Halteria grandinella]|uniref:Response regulatory domain-containing protein n=1 Tax=Halteria grandinella TaxID=5974 RepID=A0A8J8SVS6_HALGN|nr:hypothetical protein FGO68_gene15474 [Halteria grandinella]
MLRNFPLRPLLNGERLQTLTQCTINNTVTPQALSDRCPCKTRPPILAVDDNIFNIVALQTVLEYDFNLQSEKALNGLEALAKVQERAKDVAEYPCICGKEDPDSNFSVIFMDCNMPIMDGFMGTARIKEYLGDEKMKKMVIVALTAYTGEQFKEKCLMSGMNGYLTKPISAGQLRAFLREHTKHVQ